MSWKCFHCGDTFRSERAARLHFGPPDEERRPACQIKASEGGLLEALRRAESDAADAWGAVHAESAEGIKAYQANLSRHHAALISAEEAGYERGLADHARSIAILRRALAWHGDPQRLATTREEWQQEIDEAIRWVRDNPEPDGRPSFPSWAEPAAG